MECCCKIRVRVDEGELIRVKIHEGATPMKTQEKSATPGDAAFDVLPDEGYLLSAVHVGAIPSNYGKISYNGAALTVS